MSNSTSPTAAPHDAALQALLSAIASRDGTSASRLLADSPVLARTAVETGATRAGGRDFFFPEIAHYVYAGDTPLHLAAAAHLRDFVEELLANGADVRARNRRGAEPLHYACDGAPGSAGWDPDAQAAIVEFLIGAGADPNAEDKSGVAPLHRAVRTRSTGAVRALLALGADARRKNKSGSTPLHLAVQDTGRGGTGSAPARQEQGHVIRLLLAHGARPADQDAAGRSVTDRITADWIHALLAGGAQ